MDFNGGAMDLYGDSLKLQEMIDSDMRTEIDEFMPTSQMFSENSGGQGQLSPTLTGMVSNTGLGEPMDSMDNIGSIDTSDLLNNGGGIGVAWIGTNGHPMYSFNMDFETLGGLLVNPQTGLPISLAMPTALSPIITSSNVTLNEAAVTMTSPVIGGHSQQFNTSDMERDNNLTLNQISNASPVGPIYLLQNAAHLNPTNTTAGQEMNLNSAVAIQRETEQQQPKIMSEVRNQQQQQLQPTRLTAETPKKKSNNRANINNKTTSLDIVTTLNENEKTFPKPAYSYSCLIAMALKNSKSGSLPVNEIYNFMTEHFPYFKTAPAGWKNSVRHNLSLNKCFEKVDKPVPVNAGGARKGCLWAMNPAKISKMEEELRKWRSRNPKEILKSMANPEKLEMLEAGEMKPLMDEGLEEDDNVDSDDPQQPVVSSTEEEIKKGVNNIKQEPLEEEDDSEPLFKLKIDASEIFKIKMEPTEGVDSSSNMNSPDDELPSLESSIQLDDLELQKGLWDCLDDERLQFLGDSLLNAPMCEDASTPASNQVSFINCNYFNSPLSNENVSSSTSLLNNQESVVTSSEGHAR